MKDNFDLRKFLVENRHPNFNSADEQAITLIGSSIKQLEKVVELSKEHGLSYAEEVDSLITHLVTIYNDATSVDGETHGY